MDDFTTILQMIFAFVSGSGLTAFTVVWYEQRYRQKERERTYFQEHVLTQDFYRFEAYLWDLCELYRTYDKVKNGETQLVILQGSFVTIKDQTNWHEIMVKLMLQFPRLEYKLEETGVRFNSPPKLGVRLADIGKAINELQKRIEAKEYVFESVKNIEDQLKQLSEDACALR